MDASVGGLVLGLLVGLRHAFEPDHLTAVSTLVNETADARRGAILGAIWGLGHTISLVIVGVALMMLGAVLPENVAAAFECGVAVMLIGLGARAVVRAARDVAHAPELPHRHGPRAHAHATDAPHIHVAGRTWRWRPLLVGLVHGLAGSGALTALVFAQLPGTVMRVAYIALFGLGSVAGMAIASGVAGASLRLVANGPRARRTLGLVTGCLSIVVGILWGIPMVQQLAGA